MMKAKIQGVFADTLDDVVDSDDEGDAAPLLPRRRSKHRATAAACAGTSEAARPVSAPATAQPEMTLPAQTPVVQAGSSDDEATASGVVIAMIIHVVVMRMIMIVLIVV